MNEELKAAIKTIHDYCENKKNCGTCKIRQIIGCCPSHQEMEGLPREWGDWNEQQQ